MSSAPILRLGCRPFGRRRYVLPLWLWRGLTASLLTGTPRSVAQDAIDVLATWPRPPIVSDTTHIPSEGPLALIANHYQRRGLWIGFTGGLLAREIMLRRADRAAIHFTVIGDLRLNGKVVPGTPQLFGRIARIWDMVTLPTDHTAATGRALGLRRLLGLALPPPRGRGEPICIFPEGSAGTTAGLREALPGSGSLLLLLARGGVPILPAAVWESGAVLHARFGPAFTLQPPASLQGDAIDSWAREQVMRRIAVLLPGHLRGTYSGPFATPLQESTRA